MNKYIYKYIELTDDKKQNTEILNEYGAEGWKCVQIFHEYDDLYGKAYYALLVRSLADIDKIEVDYPNDIKPMLRKWEEDLPIDNVSDPCIKCQNNPKLNMDKIGDSPCEWCRHYKWKITYGK